MSFHGRSLDDMPLAAYTTGVPPDEEESVDPDLDAAPAAPALTQQDLAAALAGPAPAVAAPAPGAKRRGLSLKLPGLGRSKKAELEKGAPFQPIPRPAEPVATFETVARAPEPAPAPAFRAAAQPAVAAAAFSAVSGAIDAPPIVQPRRQPKSKPPAGLPAAGVARKPRQLLRDPRVLAGGTVVIGLALLGVSLLGGGSPASGSGGPGSSQDTTAVVPPTPVPGTASVELTGRVTGIFTLTGATGAGPAVNSQVDATWIDSTGQSLGLSGIASQGTRTTDADFLLSWTMLIDNLAVTFTSRAGECTVGMAVGVKAVHGTFVCKDLKSGDGKHVVDLRGTYTT
jgi:hypothetical protein